MVVIGSLASMIPPDDRPGTGSRDEISTSSGGSRHAPPAPEAHAGAMTTSASTPAPAAAPGTGYVLGHSSAELARLQAQARMLAGPTGAFLTLAGIGPGMHVLDLGSGAGDVAFLVAGRVGPEGSVVGVDSSPTAVEHARERARHEGITNVTFV